METEKMEGEVLYQGKEVAKLKAATRRAQRIKGELRGQIKEAERIEQSGAKKAYMYTRIIRKLQEVSGWSEATAVSTIKTHSARRYAPRSSHIPTSCITYPRISPFLRRLWRRRRGCWRVR